VLYVYSIEAGIADSGGVLKWVVAEGGNVGSLEDLEGGDDGSISFPFISREVSASPDGDGEEWPQW
jgi:hypothetical protein